LLIACGPPTRDHGGDDTTGQPDADVAHEVDAASADGCADGAADIYTFDINKHIYRFDPGAKTFSDLGELNCAYTPSITHEVTPYSMGIDRDTNAWVLYSNGELFKVEVNNQLNCTKTAFMASPTSYTTFGMGFSTDVPNGDTDSLFILGETIKPPFGFGYGFAQLDTAAMTPTTISTDMPDVAELTGNANAELWAFFPRPMPHVAQLSKTDGSVIKEYAEPGVARQNPGFAFAHWGGDYWLFIGDYNTGEDTTVYQINGSNGGLTTTTTNTGRTIVGAGVSTCAPVVIL
jgi:hypothetical protein